MHLLTATEAAVELPGVINLFVSAAEGLMNFFNAAGEAIVNNALGILPMALVALTVLNAFVGLIGQERFEGFAQKLTGNFFTRYTILPYLGNFFLGSPVVFTLGRYLKENINLPFMRLPTERIWLL